MTASAFGGEVSEYYQRFRRGYPPEVADALATAFGLTRDDVVLDLGCGTGQLTRVLAPRAGAVLGMAPAMLAQARRATAEPNVTWLLGTDSGSQQRYAAALAAAGYAVASAVVEYSASPSVEEITGGVFSAMSPEQLPGPDARPAFTERVRAAVAPHGPLRERVRVRVLTGTR
jgi:hypothetical protein